MRSDWYECKHILCIRPDNLGDLLMSTPAIRALKETFLCKITVLTSSAASSIAPMIREIDDVIVYDLPWVKHKRQCTSDDFDAIVHELKERAFDACVLFTVYSQNPLPTVMLAYLAGIPRRLAYCRENPYALLTDWVPDQEPYSFIQHQVRRDLYLVATIGATTKNEQFCLHISSTTAEEVRDILLNKGIDPEQPLIIIHAGVSEEKRKYKEGNWITIGKQIIKEFGCQVLLTGVKQESALTDSLTAAIGKGAYSLAGELSLVQFAQLIKQTSLVVSVNTATVHIAAAVQTPVIVLYALTNPQHAPWKGKGKLLLFDVPHALCSKNEVIRYVHAQWHPKDVTMPTPEEVLQAVRQLLSRDTDCLIPELIPLRIPADQML
jgi:ADP-heptose:LPS heptosyltransferase